MKKEIIPKDTRYVPLTQQNYLCVPTCMQMIMLRNGISLVAAELMASHMDIVVSPEHKKFFWNLPSVRKRPPAGYGTRIHEDSMANNMFNKLKIPLEMKTRFISQFQNKDDLLNYLHQRVKDDTDTMICYDYGTLFNTGKHSGHLSVLDTVDKAKKQVRFIDPERNVPKWRIVSASKLFKSMQSHGDEYMGGCWEISKK